MQAAEQNFLPPTIIARASVTKVPQLSHLTIADDFGVGLTDCDRCDRER